MELNSVLNLKDVRLNLVSQSFSYRYGFLEVC